MTSPHTASPAAPSETAPAPDALPRVQDDLFRHVNGEWLAKDAIPADPPIHGAFQALRDPSAAGCRAIAGTAARDPGP